MQHQSPSSKQLIVICPLEFERSLLCAAGVDQFATIACSGPGQRAITQAVEQLNTVPATIMLVGVAGGLAPQTAAGETHLVTTVASDTSNEQQQPTVQTLPGLELKPCAVCSVDEPITAVQAKRDLYARCGADIVDTESSAFAGACMKRDLQWGIIRGISDGPHDTLPKELLMCVDAQGRPKTTRSVLLAIRHPILIPGMWRLRNNSVRSMKRAAELLRVLNETT